MCHHALHVERQERLSTRPSNATANGLAAFMSVHLQGSDISQELFVLIDLDQCAGLGGVGSNGKSARRDKWRLRSAT
jgi:hypothetical protein